MYILQKNVLKEIEHRLVPRYPNPSPRDNQKTGRWGDSSDRVTDGATKNTNVVALEKCKQNKIEKQDNQGNGHSVHGETYRNPRGVRNARDFKMLLFTPHY